MNIINKAARFIIHVTLIVLISAVSLFILVNALFFLLPQDFGDKLTYKALEATNLLNTGVKPKDSEEYKNAINDHIVVSQWISYCLADKPVPRELLYHLDAPVSQNERDKRQDKQVFISPIYMRLAILSEMLSNRRIALDRNLSGSYTVAQVGAFLSILIGLLTTVLVGLNSTDIGKQQNRIGLTIRVSALALPALGTAVAALIAFYDPNGNLARQSQVSAGLQQLHSQVSMVVWKTTCDKPEDIATKLDTWTQRMGDLISNVGDNRTQSASTQNKPTGQSAGQSTG